MTNKEDVTGEIYLITNIETNKCYVGQAVSHRKNRGKYRPFGHIGRFKDHISEAICNTKKKQCSYLNASIRKYGELAFKVELIEKCKCSEMNDREIQNIKIYNTLYPNGYNLTTGGKTHGIEHDIAIADKNKAGIRGGCKFRSDATRKLISERLKEAVDVSRLSQNTKLQHMRTKLERFKNVTIDESKIDSYIRKQSKVVVVKIGGETTRFYGKQQSIEELVLEAKEFIQTLIRQRFQIAGSP